MAAELAVSVVRFYGLLVLFLWPGYVLASRLALRGRNGWFLIARGFVYSLGIFAIVGFPGLLIGIRTRTHVAVISLVWITIVVGSLVASIRRRLQPVIPSPASDPPHLRGPSVELTIERPFGNQKRTLLYGALAVYFAAWLIMSHAAFAMRDAYAEGRWSLGLLLFVLFLWPVCALIVFPEMLRDRATSVHEAEEGSPSLLFVAAAIGAIVVTIVLTVSTAWPDADDSYYLGAVRRVMDQERLNLEEPTLPREGLPVAPHMRLLIWELFGGTLCRLSGCPPLVSHPTLLAPLIVLVVFLVHWELFVTVVGSQRLVPLMIVALAVYFLAANWNQYSAGNCLFERPWQGKWVLRLAGIPFLVLSLWEYLERPNWQTWGSSFLATTAALAMSSSAVFLVAVLVPCFYGSYAVWGATRRSWKSLAGAMGFLVPVAGYGVAILWGMSSHPVLRRQSGSAEWNRTLFEWMDPSVIAWLFSMPILIVLVSTRATRGYLLGLPFLLVVTTLNPIAYDPVASYLTSYHTYHRLYWLIPVSVTTSIAVVLVWHLVATLGGLRGYAYEVVMVIAVIASVGSLAMTPGVWSVWRQGRNHNDWQIGTMYRMPPRLRVVLEQMAEEEEETADGRLLFPIRLGPYIVPYSSNYRVVCSRPSYLTETLMAVGRAEEARERILLADEFLRGALPDKVAKKLLEKHQVERIIVDGQCPTDTRVQMAKNGYQLTDECGEFQLWSRLLVKGAGIRNGKALSAIAHLRNAFRERWTSGPSPWRIP